MDVREFEKKFPDNKPLLASQLAEDEPFQNGKTYSSQLDLL